MRVFLAVEVSAIAPAVATVTRGLRAVVSRLEPGADRSVSWSRTPQPHVTLHFLGEQPDARVAVLASACDEPWPVEAFTATFSGLGTFPPTGPVRVVWLGCRRGAEGFAALHAAAGTRLRARGFAIEPGPWTPHVTIGRVRGRAPAGLRPGLAEACPSHEAACTIDAVTLFRSRLSASGPAYEVLARGRLIP